LTARVAGSLFLHLWNEVLRRAHVAKTMLPPRGSLLRSIIDRHPVDGWQGEYDLCVLEHLLSLEEELRKIRKELSALRKDNRSIKQSLRTEVHEAADATGARLKRAPYGAMKSILAARLRATERTIVSLGHYLKSRI